MCSYFNPDDIHIFFNIGGKLKSYDAFRSLMRLIKKGFKGVICFKFAFDIYKLLSSERWKYDHLEIILLQYLN